MSNEDSRKRKDRFRLNTPEEEARIQAGIAQDPDNPEIKPEQWKKMRPFPEVMAERRAARGRPKADVTKEPVTVRYDAEVLAFFRDGGSGWQTRMNEVLLEYVRKQRAR